MANLMASRKTGAADFPKLLIPERSLKDGIGYSYRSWFFHDCAAILSDPFSIGDLNKSVEITIKMCSSFKVIIQFIFQGRKETQAYFVSDLSFSAGAGFENSRLSEFLCSFNNEFAGQENLCSFILFACIHWHIYHVSPQLVLHCSSWQEAWCPALLIWKSALVGRRKKQPFGRPDGTFFNYSKKKYPLHSCETAMLWNVRSGYKETHKGQQHQKSSRK